MMLLLTSLCSYSRPIRTFFQEYAYKEQKKEGFLLIELLCVLAGTTIIIFAYMQWCLLLHASALDAQACAFMLNQTEAALERGETKKGDALIIEPIAGSWDVVCNGTVLTAHTFKPFLVTAHHFRAKQQRTYTSIGAYCEKTARKERV